MEKRVPKGRKMWTVQIDENGGVQIPKNKLGAEEFSALIFYGNLRAGLACGGLRRCRLGGK